MATPTRHFGSTGSASSGGTSSSVSNRRANLTEEERNKLRAAAKESSDEYFARGKAAKEAGLRRLRQRRGPFKFSAGSDVKYGTPVSERPVAKRRPPLQAVDIGRPAMGSKGINEENLSDSQRTLLRRMRRRSV